MFPRHQKHVHQRSVGSGKKIFGGGKGVTESNWAQKPCKLYIIIYKGMNKLKNTEVT